MRYAFNSVSFKRLIRFETGLFDKLRGSVGEVARRFGSSAIQTPRIGHLLFSVIFIVIAWVARV